MKGANVECIIVHYHEACNLVEEYRARFVNDKLKALSKWLNSVITSKKSLTNILSIDCVKQSVRRVHPKKCSTTLLHDILGLFIDICCHWRWRRMREEGWNILK